MEKMVKINSTVVSRKGMTSYSDNEDNFYINGRFVNEYEADNIQVSNENSRQKHLFAICDGLDMERTGEKASVSMVKELKKLHGEMNDGNKDIQAILDQLKECAQVTSNLIYSLSLGNPIREGRETSFAGLIITGTKAAALNIGNSAIYLLRGGILKPLSTDHKKLERMLRLGIITEEQVKTLMMHSDAPTKESDAKAQLSGILELRAGDIFLMCSDGFSGVEDEEIQEILSSNEDTGFVSNMLVKSALQSRSRDDITVLVIKIEEISGDDIADISGAAKPKGSKNLHNQVRKYTKEYGKKNEKTLTIIAALVTCLVLAGLVLMVYKSWNSKEDEAKAVAALPSAHSTTMQQTSEPLGQSGPGQTPTAKPTNEGSNDQKDSTKPSSYQVKAGDNLQQISRKLYGTSDKYTLIMEKNNIKDPGDLKVGQILIIP